MTNETIARDILTRINTGDIAGAAAHMAEDCKNHQALPEAQGRAGFTTILNKLRDAVPDLRYELVSLVASGDQVALVTTVTGTHTGRLAFVNLPLAPTGKSLRYTQIHVMRFANGKIVENHTCTDQMAFLRQLGLQIVQA